MELGMKYRQKELMNDAEDHHKLKELVFAVFHSALKADETKLYQVCLLHIVSLAQMLYPLFLPSTSSIWHFGNSADTVSNFFGALHIYPLYDSFSAFAYLILLYGMIAYVLLLLVLAAYLAKAGHKHSKALAWCLALFLVCNQTILFFPVLGTLVSVGNCEKLQGFACWGVEHSLHFCFGTGFAIVFMVLQFFTCILYYDPFMSSRAQNALSKKWTPIPLFELLAKSLVLLAYFCVGDSKEYVGWIVGLSYVLGYGYIFSLCLRQQVYLLFHSHLLFTLFSGVVAFGGATLVLGLLLESSEYSASLEVLLLGSALLSVLALFSINQTNTTLLLKDPVSRNKPEDVHQGVSEILSAVDNSDFKESEVSLLGFLLLHGRHCARPECALRVCELEMMDRKNTKQMYMRNSFLNFCNYQYFLALQKFPDSVPLRLAYSQFLVERLNNTSMGMSELLQCENRESSGLVVHFTVYRLKMLVREMVINTGKGDQEGISEASIIIYDSTLKEFRRQIEQISVAHFQLWSLLYEDSPNMQKVMKVGRQILGGLESIEDLWKRLEHLNPNNLQVLKLYATFHGEVVNDVETAKGLFGKVKEFGFARSQLSKFRVATHKLVHNINATGDGSAYIILSGHLNQIGIINGCNMSLCRVFGYQKRELVGTGVELLMPDVLQKHHREMLSRHLEYKETAEEAKFPDVPTFGLHKNGYVFPTTLRILATPSFINNSSFIAMFSTEKQNYKSTVAYLLLDKLRKVRYASSSATTLLQLDKSLLNLETINAPMLMPKLFGEDVEYYCAKAGADIDYFYPSSQFSPLSGTLEEEGTSTHKKLKKVTLGDLEHARLRCNMGKLRMGTHGNVGYAVRLEVPEPIKQEHQITKTIAHPLFQFRYDEGLHKFVREVHNPHARHEMKYSHTISMGQYADTDDNDQRKERLERMLSRGSGAGKECRRAPQIDPDEAKDEIQSKMSEISASQSKTGFYASLLPKIKAISKFVENSSVQSSSCAQELAALLCLKRVDYGRDVTTYRLVNGTLVEVNEEIGQIGLLNHDQTTRMILDDDEDVSRREGSALSMLSQIKTRDTLKLRLSESSLPRELWVLLLVFLLIGASLIVFSSLLYSFAKDYFNKTHDELHAMDDAHLLYSQALCALYDVREAVLLQKGLSGEQDFRGVTSTAYLLELQENVEEHSANLFTLEDEVSRQVFNVPNVHEIEQIFDRQSIVFEYLIDGKVSYFPMTVSEMVISLIAHMHAFSSFSVEECVESNFHIYFLLRNGFSSMETAMETLDTVLDTALLLEKDSNKAAVLSVFILAICCSVLLLPITILCIRSVHLTQERLLSLLLELPSKVLKMLSLKCEMFVHNLHSGRVGEVDSVEDTELGEKAADYSFLEYTARRMRKFSEKPQFLLLLSVALLLGVLAITLFLSLAYYYSTSYRSNLNGMVEDLSRLLRVESVSLLALNYQRECFLDTLQGSSLLGDATGKRCEKAREMIERGYNVTQVLEGMNVEAKMTDDSAQSQIRAILHGDLTQQSHIVSSASVGQIQCPEEIESVTKQGLDPVVTYYFKLLRTTLTENWNNASKSSAALKSAPLLYTAVLQREYISPFVKKLVEIWHDGLTHKGQKAVAVVLALTLVLAFLLCFVFLFLWRPFVNHIGDKVATNRMMLSIVPIQVLTKCKSISYFIDHHLLTR